MLMTGESVLTATLSTSHKSAFITALLPLYIFSILSDVVQNDDGFLPSYLIRFTIFQANWRANHRFGITTAQGLNRASR